MIDLPLALAGLLGGLCVGLTGMGGGALMTPMLVLVFHVNPLAAVSTDVVASLVMKPIGGGVHLRAGSVHTGIVRWLALGSVPAAFLGALLLRFLGEGPALAERLQSLLGATLLLAAGAMTIRVLLQARRSHPAVAIAHVPVRRVATVVVGAVGGLVVGLTSVGSGSLMVVLLLGLYPGLSGAALVGTDLVQAIPLVASAAVGHLIFGDLHLGLTGSLLVGCLPGVYLGARLSSRAPDQALRPALVAVLVASAAKLLGAATVLAVVGGLGLGAVTVAVTVLGAAAPRAVSSSSLLGPPALAPALSRPCGAGRAGRSSTRWRRAS